jgi:hypothetical protein
MSNSLRQFCSPITFALHCTIELSGGSFTGFDPRAVSVRSILSFAQLRNPTAWHARNQLFETGVSANELRMFHDISAGEYLILRHTPQRDKYESLI